MNKSFRMAIGGTVGEIGARSGIIKYLDIAITSNSNTDSNVTHNIRMGRNTLNIRKGKLNTKLEK